MGKSIFTASLIQTLKESITDLNLALLGRRGELVRPTRATIDDTNSEITVNQSERYQCAPSYSPELFTVLKWGKTRVTLGGASG